MKWINVLAFLCFAILLISGRQEFDLKKSMERGKGIYLTQCTSCHLEKGGGIETIYPPLAKSDFLMNETEKSIEIVLHGGNETITVNGITYNGDMPTFDLTDEQVSDVMNYIRNSWGNTGEPITPEHVKAIRK